MPSSSGERMYVDKLDGKVDGAFFERMSAEWRAQQNYCLREIEQHALAPEADRTRPAAGR
jgi:site-specific DNA recombinase